MCEAMLVMMEDRIYQLEQALTKERKETRLEIAVFLKNIVESHYHDSGVDCILQDIELLSQELTR